MSQLTSFQIPTSDHYFDKAKRKLESCDHHEIFIAPCEKVLGSQLESRWKKTWKKNSTVYGPSLSQQFSHQSLSSFWHHLFFVFRVTGPHIDKVLCTFPLQRFFEFSLQNSWNEHCENLIKCTCWKTSSKVSEKYWFCWIRAFPVLSNQSKCVKIVHSGCLGLRDFT